MDMKIKFLLFVLLLCSVASYGKGTELKVLQINLWYEGGKIENGFDAIVNEVNSINPDIVLFCEISNRDGKPFIPRIVEALKEKGKQYYGETNKLDVGVISKYKILEQRLNYPKDNKAGSVLKTTIQVGNRKVIAYSAHLDYTHYACYLPRGYSGVTWKKLDAPVLDVAQVEKANNESMRDEAIQGVLDDVKSEKGNIIILGGDFNEPSHLDWQENTKNLWDHNGTVIRWDCSVMLYANGFKDAFREFYPNPVTHPGFTFPAGNENVAVKELAWAPDVDERDRIDFIYYMPDKKLKLKHVSVVGPSKSVIYGKCAEETSKDKFILPAGVWPTDHKAVLATFRLHE